MNGATKALFVLILIILYIVTLGAVLKYVERTKEKQSSYQNTIENLEAERSRLQHNIVELSSGVEVPIDQRFLLWPIEPDDYSHLSSYVGPRTLPAYGGQYRFHKGLDIVGVPGARIRASFGGKISDIYPAPGQSPKPRQGGEWRGHDTKGGYVEITHANGYKTRYSHMSEVFPEWFVIGTTINAGDIIGRQGNTGLSLADHIHFEVLEYGIHVNPLKFLMEAI